MKRKEIIIIGGGPAGMAAAIKLNELGFRDTLVIEKERIVGGVLRQCIHHGFGLIKFGKNFTGPEYKNLYEELLKKNNVEVLTQSTVLSIESRETWIGRKKDNKSEEENKTETEKSGIISRVVVSVQTPDGIEEFTADAAILASGCRERGRGSLNIPGSRPAGIFSAGTAQGLMNLRNIKVGNRIIIVGSGDIGLIMARRFTLEGSEVVCVVEKASVCGGLERNRRECLEDFEIPLMTDSVVCNIIGKKRVEGAVIRDENGNETEYSCDTIILSAGLVPEDGMAEKNIDGLFYCGNALFVHDLVDDVSECGENVALDVAGYLLAKMKGREYDSQYSSIEIANTRAERKEFLKKRIDEKKNAKISDEYIICTQCPNGCKINKNTFTGGRCDKGREYVMNELKNPKRILTSTVKIKGKNETVSVRTEFPIPKSLLKNGMDRINSMEVDAPVEISTIIEKDFLGTGIDLIATDNAVY